MEKDSDFMYRSFTLYIYIYILVKTAFAEKSFRLKIISFVYFCGINWNFSSLYFFLLRVICINLRNFRNFFFVEYYFSWPSYSTLSLISQWVVWFMVKYWFWKYCIFKAYNIKYKRINHEPIEIFSHDTFAVGHFCYWFYSHALHFVIFRRLSLFLFCSLRLWISNLLLSIKYCKTNVQKKKL